MKRHCFTYGSLMCEEIMRAVSGLPSLAREEAELAGYARHPVAGERYPGMVADAIGSVSGVLYRDLPAVALERLDVFEGEQYERRSVRVKCSDGRTVEAETYVFRPAFAHLLTAGDWDFEAFLRSGRKQFEARYLGYKRIAR